jgi:hypothetical protein
MTGFYCAFGENEVETLLITPGDHVAVYTTPTADDGITRQLELKVVPDSHATATIPGTSGWAEAEDSGNRNIDINRCDDVVAEPVDNPDEIYTLGYHGTASGTAGYNFVTFIDDGIITYCKESDNEGGAPGGGGGGSPHTFTLLITDQDTVHIKPNPAYVEVTTAEVDHWIKLTAGRYIPGEEEMLFVPVEMDWLHVTDINYSATEGGGVMTPSEVNDYKREFIWSKSSVAGEYIIKSQTIGGGVEANSVLNVSSINPAKITANNRNGLAKIHISTVPSINISNISLRLVFGEFDMELENWDVDISGNFTVPFDQNDIANTSIESGAIHLTVTTNDGFVLKSVIDVERTVDLWEGNDTYYKIYTWGDASGGGTHPVLAGLKLHEYLNILEYSIPFEGFGVLHSASTLLISNISPHADGYTGDDSQINYATHKIYDKDGEVVHTSEMHGAIEPILIPGNSKYRELKSGFWTSHDDVGHTEAKIQIGWSTLNGLLLPIPHISPLQDTTVEARHEEEE